MQSSGASTVALTLAQKRSCVAFVDIWNMFAAPELDSDDDIIAKAVVTTAFPLALHKQRFRPDLTILVLRHPADNYRSLADKSYANESGLLDEKFRVLDDVFSRAADYDIIVHYEDMLFRPAAVIDMLDAAGWRLDDDALSLSRTERDIRDFNIATMPSIGRRLHYGGGNFRPHAARHGLVRFAADAGATVPIAELCPAAVEHYRAVREQRGDAWHVPDAPLLSCALHPLLEQIVDAAMPAQASGTSPYAASLQGGVAARSQHGDVLEITPDAGAVTVQLRLGGLPGIPFNRITGLVWAKNPCGAGIHLRLRVEGPDGQPIAGTEINLRNGATDYFNLADTASLPSKALSLDIAQDMTDGTLPPNCLCLEALSLDHVAPG